MFSALGSKDRSDLIDGIRRYLESQYVSNKEDTKSCAITSFVTSERDQFSGDVECVMELYKTNFETRLALLSNSRAEMERIQVSAQRTFDDIAQRYYNKALSRLPSLWDQSNKSVEQFEWYVRNEAADPQRLCKELSEACVSAGNERVNAANVTLANAEWAGVRLNSDAPPQPFSCQVLSQVTMSERSSVAGLQTTFTGGEGLGTGFTVGAVGAGIGAIALGPIGLVAGLIGILAGSITKRGRCMSKAKEALKNCYEENARRQLDALEKGFASTLSKVREAVDRSLAEHHGKDITGVMDHAVLADNSCMVLHLTPPKPQYQGPKGFHRNGENFESFYTADLSIVVPEIARSWDAGCLREWGEAVSSQFTDQWHQVLYKIPSLSSREGAIEFYSERLKDAVVSEMETQRELLIEPSKLLQECSIREDLRGTVPSFAQVLSSCDCSHLRALKSFTAMEYESEFNSEYSRRINQAFADGRPYLGSELIKAFRPGCLITIAIVLGLVGLSSGVTALVVIGGVGICATIIGWLLSKRQARKRAIRFAEEVVGAFYQEVVSELETSIRDRFQPPSRAK